MVLEVKHQAKTVSCSVLFVPSVDLVAYIYHRHQYLPATSSKIKHDLQV